MGRRRFKVYQRGGSAMSNVSRLLVKNARRRHSNQMGSGFCVVAKKIFKMLTGEKARKIGKNVILPFVYDQLNKRILRVFFFFQIIIECGMCILNLESNQGNLF